MERYNKSGGAGNAPTPDAGADNLFPTGGDATQGIEASTPGPYWRYMITEELRAVIVAAGITPDHTSVVQLLAALQKLDVVGDVSIKSLSANGYYKLPGGLIIQWREGSLTSPPGNVPVTWPVAFPNAVLLAFAADKTSGSDLARAFTWRSDLGSLSQSYFGSDATSGTGVFSAIAIGY